MRCPSCFFEKWNHIQCDKCGYELNFLHEGSKLPIGHFLRNGEYVVGKVLGKPGGFGITYLAWDTRLDIKVAIKEFLPFQLASRNADGSSVSIHAQEYKENFSLGLDKFLEEAKILAQLRNSNIVRVSNYFAENGTGYIVMDYIEGESLQEYMERIGRIRTEDAVELMLPILKALDYLHSKDIIHRDVKPTNIYITNDGQPVLLDFGSARQTMLCENLSMTAVVSPGYAPIEQYNRKGKQGAFTDIYSCAAVLYQMISGIQPQESLLRNVEEETIPLSDIDSQIPPWVNEAIMWGLKINPNERPKDVREFVNLLCQTKERVNIQKVTENIEGNHNPINEQNSEIDQGKVEGKPKNKTLNNKKWVYMAVAGVLLISILFYWDLNREKTIEHTIRVGNNEYTGVYHGKVRGGKPDGYGEFKYSFVNEKAIVLTRQKFEDGIEKSEVFYSGGFRDGAYEGKGTLIINTELRYKSVNDKEAQGGIAENLITKLEGEWNAGELNGKAIMGISGKQDQCKENKCKLENYNEKYEGDVRKGSKHGLGILTKTHGMEQERLEGRWVDGLLDNGKAEISDSFGKYVGEYKKFQPHGKGVYLYSDGDKYDGMWEEGARSGQGEYLYSDGSRYSGQWRKGKYNGSGEYMFAGGVKVVGVFKEGVPVSENGKDRIILPNGRMVWGRCSGTGGTGFECSWHE